MQKNISKGVVVRIFLIIGFLTFYKIALAPQIATQLPLVKSVSTSSDAPEMKDILGGDQKMRLEAARKLVERVGVESALEILEHSTLPHTGEGHLVVHQIGFYAYRKYGLDSILHCKDYFLFACYHGAIIEAAGDQGFEAIAKMTDKCKGASSRYFQCVHAAGHAILAVWDYDNLPDALKTCDKLYEKETAFPEAVSSCHNGVFMENLFGVHDWGAGREAKRKWLSADPYYPCNAMGEKYQKGCWLNQAARIYQLNQGDIGKTAYICQQIGQGQYTTWCMDNLDRQIHPITAGNISKVFELCQTLGTGWSDQCIIVNAGSYYSVGGRDQAIEICKKISSFTTKSQCYQTILGQIVGDTVDTAEKKNLCGKLEESYSLTCLGQIGP